MDIVAKVDMDTVDMDMVGMEMVDMDMVDMGMVDMDIVVMDKPDSRILGLVYLQVHHLIFHGDRVMTTYCHFYI